EPGPQPHEDAVAADRDAERLLVLARLELVGRQELDRQGRAQRGVVAPSVALAHELPRRARLGDELRDRVAPDRRLLDLHTEEVVAMDLARLAGDEEERKDEERERAAHGGMRARGREVGERRSAWLAGASLARGSPTS